MQVITTRQAAGREPLAALADGMKAILCSPSFLYLEEPGDDGLTSTALASRLSYFLWASMPDDELRALAASDALRNPDALARASPPDAGRPTLGRHDRWFFG